MTRPAIPLSDDERVAGVLRDAITALEHLAALHPTDGIGEIATSLDWAAREIERGFDPATGARK